VRGAAVHSLGDHRLAMAFAVAGQRVDGELRVDDCANVATSFPGFMDLVCKVGMGLRNG
jgi:5-enolpyruvylshikimate-3-phosphate synthase